tara:strand:+ start:256 stop:435 length:180 start_codon:yes stop_codon:yes gene_type:complete
MKTIDDMRYELAELEAMNITTLDLVNMLIEGFEGLENMPDIEVREDWENTFGVPDSEDS